jgi:hypothetical protein
MGRTYTASHLLEAEPERVYAALVDADALLARLPPVGMTAKFDRFDGRPGGGYRMVLTYADASTAPCKATADSDVVEALHRHGPRRAGRAGGGLRLRRSRLFRHHDHDVGTVQSRSRDPNRDSSRRRS